MKTVDFRGREVELNELVGAVYYQGELLHAKIHKINDGGGVKLAFISEWDIKHEKPPTISVWKKPDVIVKLDGVIVPEHYHVNYITGETLHYAKVDYSNPDIS